MRDAANTVAGRTARLLLLLATLLGVTAMHSLGHGAGPHPSAMTAHGHSASGAATPMLAMPDPCADDNCSHATMSGDRHGGMTGWDICLAVLVAFAVALLVAALLKARLTIAWAGTDPHASTLTGPRAPPAGPLGLTLASVSVLRT